MDVLHQDYDEVMALISANDVRQRYRENTAAALDMGIFGVPSFTKGKEIFWGDDRLEDALEYDD
jgi:2-hydroxychromene-2-carboxylate isomerase